MQTAASNSLVLTEFSSSSGVLDSQTGISYGGFYQEIASGLIRGGCARQVLHNLGDRLVVLAEHAYAFRQMDALEQLSQALVNSPLPREYEPVGQYYQALGIQRFGNGDVEQAARLIGRLATTAPPRYRIKALISFAANSFYRGDFRFAACLCREADIFASRESQYDLYTTIHTQRMFALISSEDGNHRDALAVLENLLPLAQSVRLLQPHVYCDYLNSLAVELCAVGRLQEAQNVSEIVLASPFARAYPEWHETRQDIDLRGLRASRSTVGFSHSEARMPSSVPAEFAADSVVVSKGTAEASNILRFPIHELTAGIGLAAPSSDTKEPARVLVMSECNRTMGRDSSETQAKQNYEEMDGRQLLLKIMELTAATDLTDYELLEIVKSIESILYRQRDPR